MKIHWIFRVVSLFNYQGPRRNLRFRYNRLTSGCLCCSRSDSFILSQLIFIVKHFFKSFWKSFLNCFNDLLISNSFAMLPHSLWFVNNIFQIFLKNAMARRWRDLNPRAGRPTYTLSRGASSATWVHLLAWKFATKVLIFQCNRHSYYASAKSSLTKKALSVNGFFDFFENNFCYCLYSRYNIKSILDVVSYYFLLI